MEAQLATQQPVTKKPQWPPIRKHEVVGHIYWLVDLGLINGKRQRKVFKTWREANTFADQARIARKNEGREAFSLGTHVRVDATKASSILKPHGISLVEAAQYYLQHVITYRNAPKVKELVERVIAEAKTVKRRERTISELEGRLGRFVKAFGERQLTSIPLSEIESWLNDPLLGARSRINYATKLSQLFNFAIKHGWAEHNLIERISRPEPEDEEPGVLSVEQAANLLGRAEKFHLLPYVALGLFAGLRSAELLRLQWSAIKFVDRAIIVGAEVAKKRSRRVIDINDTLAMWLAPYTGQKGAVVRVEKFREHFDALRVAAKDPIDDVIKVGDIKEWHQNCLRHSFGSYHLSMFGDAVKTAMLMGHQDVAVLHNHYKALVLKSEAERFWGLRPIKTAANVIPIRQSA